MCYTNWSLVSPSLCPLWLFVFFVILMASKEMDHKEHKEPQRTQRYIIKDKMVFSLGLGMDTTIIY